MKKFYLFILVSFLLSNIGILHAQTCTSTRYTDTIFHDVNVISGVQFATATPYGLLAQPQNLLMDIYMPFGDTLTKRPLIVFQFGGGFLIGWRSQPDIPAFCNYFAKCGYVVVSIDYRIGFNTISTGSAERAVYRAVQDQRSAIRFMCENRAQYRIDTNNIFLTGTSAGCFAGLHSTFMSQTDAPISYQGIPLESDDLGCIDCSGNNYYGGRAPRAKGIINQWGAILDTAFIEASENVPVISFHGTNDNAVPYEYGYPFSYPVFPNVYGSKPIHERLTNLGIKNTLVPLVGFGHEPELLNPQLNDTIYNRSRVFLLDILKPITTIVGDTLVCNGTTHTYTFNGLPRSTFCRSVIGNGVTVNASTATGITLTFADTGWVQIKVQELSEVRASGDEVTLNIYVNPQPVASFTYTVNELEVALTNTSTSATSTVWDIDNNIVDTLLNPSFTFAQPGTYHIYLNVANSICESTSLQLVDVDTCPVANFSYQITGTNGIFNATSTNSSTYHWNFGDGDSATVSSLNVFHPYASGGNYTVTLQVENQLGCKETYTQNVDVFYAGIDETANENISIYPNPFNNQLTIKAANATYKLYSADGRLISEGKAGVINTESFSRGIYTLQVCTESGNRTFRVLK
jgi:PKD repeat protein